MRRVGSQDSLSWKYGTSHPHLDVSEELFRAWWWCGWLISGVISEPSGNQELNKIMSEKSSPARKWETAQRRPNTARLRQSQHGLYGSIMTPKMPMNMLGHVMSRVPCEMFRTGIHVLETQSSDGVGDLMRCALVAEVGYQDGAFNCVSVLGSLLVSVLILCGKRPCSSTCARSHALLQAQKDKGCSPRMKTRKLWANGIIIFSFHDSLRRLLQW